MEADPFVSVAYLDDGWVKVSVELPPDAWADGSADDLWLAYAGATLSEEANVRRLQAARARRWPRTCDQCGVVFEPHAAHARFCSGTCRGAAYRASDG